MTHAKLAIPMGLAMGAMLPVMLHGPVAAAGPAFVLAHLAVVLALAAAALLFPGLRRRIAMHRPGWRHLGAMAGAAVLALALVCVHCLATGHAVPEWLAG